MPDRSATPQTLHALFHSRAMAVVRAFGGTTRHSYVVLTTMRSTGSGGGRYANGVAGPEPLAGFVTAALRDLPGPVAPNTLTLPRS